MKRNFGGVIFFAIYLGTSACVGGGSSELNDNVKKLQRSELSDESRALISECAVGLSSSTRAKIEAAVSLAEGRGEAGIGIDSEVRGVIMSEGTFKSDQAKLDAYAQYRSCARDFREDRRAQEEARRRQEAAKREEGVRAEQVRYDRCVRSCNTQRDAQLDELDRLRDDRDALESCINDVSASRVMRCANDGNYSFAFCSQRLSGPGYYESDKGICLNNLQQQRNASLSNHRACISRC